ncbi:glycosyl transferase [Rhodococcus sp. 14-2470-1b]|uniref:DUF1972 domain-containing protein n=1 Tax=Rhodococcus sp. 14-2470-1b TaxID=2023149 RepID=UPI000B9C5EF5|nr:DUF1972 domain-containing protein [Rhodococcus sp. 14-2470-1b]OZF54478.1 glycosyl transferase [Rhodococcus sp. 14-2470-1b]
MTAKEVAIIGTRGYPSYYGGFETLVRRLAPYLADEGWAVSVYGRKGAIRADDPNRDERVRSIVIPGVETKSLSTLTSGLTNCAHTAYEKPDVALVMNVANGFFLPALRFRGVRTIVNVDGMEWEREKWGKTAKKVFHSGAKLTARFADEIICDSVEIKRRWSVEFGRDGHFIPYGGDEAPFSDDDPEFRAGTYVLLVARFVPENTVAEFVKAAEDLSQRHDVVIVGSSGYGGQLEQTVQSLADRSPRVHWLGHVSDDRRLFSLWKHAGAYFHGHSVGGTNPALVQAMACGAPIVARDTVYNREVIGDAGLFVSPDATAIASMIQLLMVDRQQQLTLSAAAVERAQKFYGWDEVCRKYVDALTSLNSHGKGRYA